MEQDHFQNENGMQHDLFVLLLYCLLLSVFAINACDCTYICLLHVLYCSEVGSVWVGVGLGAPMKVYICKKKNRNNFI